MPKVGADAIPLVVNVEVRHTMVIVGSATPRELTFLEDEETVNTCREVELWDADTLGKRVVDV